MADGDVCAQRFNEYESSQVYLFITIEIARLFFLGESSQLAAEFA